MSAVVCAEALGQSQLHICMYVFGIIHVSVNDGACVIRTPRGLLCSVMGHRRPSILCDPIRHFRDTLWLLFLQTCAATLANTLTQTHTHAHIPLNSCVRPLVVSLYKERH